MASAAVDTTIPSEGVTPDVLAAIDDAELDTAVIQDAPHLSEVDFTTIDVSGNVYGSNGAGT